MMNMQPNNHYLTVQQKYHGKLTRFFKDLYPRIQNINKIVN